MDKMLLKIIVSLCSFQRSKTIIDNTKVLDFRPQLLQQNITFPGVNPASLVVGAAGPGEHENQSWNRTFAGFQFIRGNSKTLRANIYLIDSVVIFTNHLAACSSRMRPTGWTWILAGSECAERPADKKGNTIPRKTLPCFLTLTLDVIYFKRPLLGL